MTPDVEAVALAWVARHLRSHRCETCGGTWITRRSVGVIFHQCSAPLLRRRRSYTFVRDREEERQEWARSILGAELEESVTEKYGEDEQLRRL